MNLLKLKDVMAKTRLSKTGIYRYVNTGKFPAPVKIGDRAVVWIEEEIDSWLKDRVAESRVQKDDCETGAMKPLTNRQQSVFDFIKAHVADKGFSPTVMEIADNFGFQSPNSVTHHLAALLRKGRISITPNVPRGIKVQA